MIIIDQRTLKIVKNEAQPVIDRFKSRQLEIDGFISTELFLNTQHQDYDVLVVQMKWESREKLMTFKQSDAHREGHKNAKPNPNILERKMLVFDVL